MEANNRAADKVGSERHDERDRDSSDSLAPNYPRTIPTAKSSCLVPAGMVGRPNTSVSLLVLGLLLLSAVLVLFIPSAPDAYSQSSPHTSTLTISNITQSNPTPSQANVNYLVVAQRDGATVIVVCDRPSGSTFQVATNPNTVQCTFSDGVVLSFKIYIDTVAPITSANPPQGTYNTTQSVTLSSNETGTTIYYTTNGSTPSTASAQYSSPIQISSTTTLKFFGRDVYLNPSSIITQQYTIDTVAPTVIPSPVGGLYNTNQFITLTPSETATIYYTTNGTPPTLSSSQYISPLAISSGTTILNYFARDSAGNSGIIGSQTYTVDTTAPIAIASPTGAVYNTVQSVTLNASETASIYYTTDGSTPTLASSQYNGSSIPVIHNTILKFIAHDTAGNTGAVVTETYTLTGTGVASSTGAGVVGFSTSAGSFTSIAAISEAALPTSGKPTGMTFDYGFFLWNVTDLTEGQEITMTITYPAAIPANTQYWTVIDGSWINLTPLLSSNNGDNELVLTITDGLQGDEDGSANGQISDPGGSATIVDITSPSITAPVDITQEASGLLTTLETLGTPTVSDNVHPSPAVTNDAPVDGFPLGNTTVTWTATDDAGNTAVANQTVTIIDTTAPSITAPADVSTEATGPLTTTVTPVTLGSPLVSDIADPSATVTNDAPVDGFPLGNTTVTWTATDDAGNTAVANQTITITDTTAPSITAPADITQAATGQLTSVDDLGSPLVSDIADPSPTVTNDAPPGGFPVGNTTVTWTATDDSSNVATAAQTITITDTSTPSITAPADITLEATSEFTLVPVGSPVVTDEEDSSPTVTNDAPVDGFPVGNTTVTWTATDDSGNSGIATQTVTITDTTAPSITAPADITLEATSQFTLVPLGSPTVSDLADPTLIISDDAPLGGFPLGNTTVTWTATDDSGNDATDTQIVTITDTGAPSITVPADIAQEATGPLTSVDDLGSPTVSDNEDPSPTVTNDAPVDGFPIGNTTVTWTATDDSGNSGIATQTVTITDTTAPSITAPADITLEATSEFTLVPLGSPTVSDLADPTLIISDDAPLGGFPVGNTTVTWTATDDSGNSAIDTQQVTITDTGAPSITAPADITLEATSEFTLVPVGSPVVTDEEDSSPTVTNDAPVDGFPVGNTTVTWTATDDSGNSGIATQTVTITDTTAPSITAPTNVTAEATGELTTVPLGSHAVSDIADQSLTATNDAPVAGFPLGLTTVVWTVTDSSGNSATATQTVTITDTTAPSITAPEDITTEATGELTTLALGSTAVSDLVDSNPTVGNNASQGGFPVGTTIVTWTATDSSGNTATDTQTVTITDSGTPSISAPAHIIQEATGELTLIDLGSPTVSDNEDPSPTVTNDAPVDGFPVGNTTVTWTATDDSGNSAIDTQQVTITDTGAPSITGPSDIIQEATGELTLIDLGSPTVSDNEDPSPTVTNDAPVDGFPVGNTTVTWTATDDSGNSATATQSVTVTDTTAPTITATVDIIQEATSQFTLVPLGSPTVSDLADPTLIISDDAPLGGFPLGNTTVTWTATDDSGNSGIATQTVTITDTTAPSITAPADVTTEATGPLTTNVTLGTPLVSDIADPSPTVTNDAPVDGFPLGNTTVTWTATDDRGNVATAAQTITITDTSTPSITAPADITLEATSEFTLVLLGSPVVTDEEDPSPTVTNDAPPGGFPVGNTTVTWTATDDSGNSANAVQMVALTDTTPPTVVALPAGNTYGTAQVVELSSSDSVSGNAAIYYTINGDLPATSSDAYSGTPIEVTVDTTLKFFGVDASGNSGTVVTESYILTGTQTQSATGTGQIFMSTSQGSFQTVSAVSESSLPTAGKPSGLIFEHGFVSFVVTGVTPGDSITLTFSYPSPMPASSQYWTVVGDTWVDLTSQLGSNDGDNVITLTVTDGGPEDEDGLANGEISDPSGSGYIADNTPPVVNAMPVGGVYSISQYVMLASSEANTDIYYTMNGDNPTTSSTPYTGVPVSISTDTTLKFFGVDSAGNASPVLIHVYDINPAPAIAMEDTTTGGSGWGIYSTRPVLSEYVSSSSTLVGKQIDSITVNIKKSESTATGAAQIGIINSDLSMKKVFATISIGALTTSYTPHEYTLSAGDTYTIQAGDRIGVKNTGGTSSSNYLAIMRDINTADPFDGANTFLSYYTTAMPPSWTSQTTYDLVMTLKYSGGGAGGGGTDTLPPTVIATPLGGSYNTPQLVTLTPNEPATIYYTLNGSIPDESSLVYSGSPLSITTTTTLKYFGKDTAGNSGTVQTQIYTMDNTPPAVTASPPGGGYTSTQSVTLEASEASTTIYFTTDGADPEPTSPVYSSPIQLTSGTTLKFYGKDQAGNFGSIGTEVYAITIPDTNPPTVTASPVAGTFGPSGTSVTLSSNEPATIHYTLDGSIPDESSNVYSSAIPITATTTLKYFGNDTAGNSGTVQTQLYTIDNVPPVVTASPVGGTYTSTQSILLTSSETGTVIRFTTNGIDPVDFSPQYSSPIGISADTTLKFFGTDSYGNAGSIVTQVYDINAPSQPPGIVMEDTTTGGSGWGIYSTRPVLSEYVSSSSVLVGKQIDSITVNLKKTAGATGMAQIGIINPDLSMKKVFATFDISTISATSYLPAEFKLPSGESYTIQAGDRIGVKYTGGTSGGNHVSIMRDLNAADPFDAANTYLSYHTTTTSSWTAQTTYDLVMTLNYSGSGASGDTTAPIVSASPVGGTFASSQSITLTANEPAIIYYTTNGDEPTDLSTSYSSAIPITTPTTLKYFGKDTAGNSGTVQTQVYTIEIDTTPPTVTATPSGGTYTSAQSVTLTSSESGTIIYYTTDGSTPNDISSPQYSSPVSITTDTTLKFYGIDSAGNIGSVGTEVYDINAPSQPPGIVMEDTTTGGSGWGIYSTRPVLSEYVSSSSVLVGKHIDSITVVLKKSSSTATGTAYVGIINPDLSMKKVFATISISALAIGYTSYEYTLSPGDYYTLEAGDRVGVKSTDNTSGSGHIAIMRDINAADPFDGANTFLSYHTTTPSPAWTAQTTYDLVMTLKYSGSGAGGE